jgi:galacturan 1,4-alpha-galacturonidase
VSFKPNSTNIIIQGLVCNSSHGISVGSLGQYPGTFDLIEHLYVYNVTLSNATDGARLKVWPGADVTKPDGWVGGGGHGLVRNVTYDTFQNINNDGAIKIDQCYGAVYAEECEADPSLVTLTDVTFKNFFGTVSKKFDPVVGSLICSSEEVSAPDGSLVLGAPTDNDLC